MGSENILITIATYAGCVVLVLLVGFGILKRPDFAIVPRRRRFRQVGVAGLVVSEVAELLRHPPRSYDLYQFDPDRGLVVWMEGPGLLTIGGFFPLYLDPSHQGVTVTCAVEPRVPLLDPMAGRRLRRVCRQVMSMTGGAMI
ncbi:hypothetical protein L2U69_01840 [Zavarzinia compransoris]|uniref:hypothetical protein n=1 Tax=Zavarzinia marina TaxID=2911065 RepID=UPI001F26A65F|nr:hypothetical protein [Zavarzinia marina]MCF4164387.1 hypothetical protein [Zavarzinia marina]